MSPKYKSEEEMTHQEICERCNGSGKVSCSNCRGKGKVENRHLTLSGLTECPKCHGKGTVDCSTCKGSGIVTIPED